HIVLFEVCSAFTHVAACTLARSPSRDRYSKASDISSPPCLPRLLPAGAIAGWALHPLEKRRLVTAHVESGLLVIGHTDKAARRLCRASLLRNVGSSYSEEPWVEIL